MTMEGYSYLVALILFIFVVVVLYIYRPPKPTLIEKPILGLLDLSGGAAVADVKADRDALGSLFYSVTESTSWLPKCDVLFVYCHIDDDGAIRGWKSGLRDLIRESGAPIVVLAKENTPVAYLAASKKTGYGFANLLMVIDRKSEVFGQFFHKLFSAMHEGVTMPVAFAKLAPPTPRGNESNCPAVIFNVEAGQIAFRESSLQAPNNAR